MSLSGCFLLQVYAEILEIKNFYPYDLPCERVSILKNDWARLVSLRDASLRV